MLGFNASSLRYKFIYLTKDIFHGIAINTIFEQALETSELKSRLCDDINFYLIDKYINFIPFSLRFDTSYALKKEHFSEDVILPSKAQDNRWVMFNNILFFIDMYNPGNTAFLCLHKQSSIQDIENKMEKFIAYCDGLILNKRKRSDSIHQYTLREQKIVFYILAGFSIKEIADVLHVSDKLIYRDRNRLASKFQEQETTRTLPMASHRQPPTYQLSQLRPE